MPAITCGHNAGTAGSRERTTCRSRERSIPTAPRSDPRSCPICVMGVPCVTIGGMSRITVRQAEPHDCASLAAIYAPYVEQTAISFEETAPGPEEFASRVARSRSRWEWLVAEIGGTVVGYAYGSEHRQRAAYRWSVEVSAYVAGGYHRRGIGRALYGELLTRLTARGFCQAFAGITLPNDASVALHARTGFAPVGVFRSVGWKFGRWHDVAWFQRTLRDQPPTS